MKILNALRKKKFIDEELADFFANIIDEGMPELKGMLEQYEDFFRFYGELLCALSKPMGVRPCG